MRHSRGHRSFLIELTLFFSVKILSNIIRDIDDYDPDISLDVEKKGNLNYISRNCGQLLGELNGYLDKFQDLKPSPRSTGLRGSTVRVWKRVRWDQEEIEVFRSRIATSINALNLIVAGLNRLDLEILLLEFNTN